MRLKTDVPDWGDYFLDIATQVAKRASCYRAAVGCVLVKNNRILSTGYNGAPSGRTGCFQRGCCYRDQNNIVSGTNLDKCYAAGAHAEINTIVNAAREGVKIKGSTMYLVGHNFCCVSCQAAILNAGISKVVLRKKDGKKSIFIPEQDFFDHPVLDTENPGDN